jgi:hypothetical protein
MTPSMGVQQDPKPRNDAGSSKSVVCTVAEGSYFYGVAALTNSLVRGGFRGSVVVGYRGGKPPWLETLTKDRASDAYVVTSEVRFRLFQIPGKWHLSNYKAHFINQIFLEIVPEADLRTS